LRENFDRVLAWIQEDEGGGAVRSDEPGGAVFHGVSLVAYAQYRKRHGQPVPTVDDLMNLSLEDEKAIYREDYADRIAFDTLPWPVDYALLNAAVMSGVNSARSMWLKARNEDPSLTAYGIIILQMQKMMQKPNVAKFGMGWANRMVRVMERINGHVA